ncbi:hypothetical protein FOA52_011890 [Chlamydomonas sp. UWO 241]|nr:hypothetical protein FOA52_011890 [Chlamydomonas sp. UWO 241]
MRQPECQFREPCVKEFFAELISDGTSNAGVAEFVKDEFPKQVKALTPIHFDNAMKSKVCRDAGQLISDAMDDGLFKSWTHLYDICSFKCTWSDLVVDVESLTPKLRGRKKKLLASRMLDADTGVDGLRGQSVAGGSSTIRLSALPPAAPVVAKLLEALARAELLASAPVSQAPPAPVPEAAMKSLSEQVARLEMELNVLRGESSTFTLENGAKEDEIGRLLDGNVTLMTVYDSMKAEIVALKTEDDSKDGEIFELELELSSAREEAAELNAQGISKARAEEIGRLAGENLRMEGAMLYLEPRAEEAGRLEAVHADNGDSSNSDSAFDSGEASAGNSSGSGNGSSIGQQSTNS